MELLQLRYFAEVARLGSYTRAAEALHVSQPSLSQTVRRLEKELGTRLFWKEGRKIRLTENGRSFYTRIVSVLRELDEASAHVTARKEHLQGNINIGTYMSLSPLLECIRAFAQQYPEVSFTINQIYSRSNEEHNHLDALLCYDHSDLLGFNEFVRLDTIVGVYVLPVGHAAPRAGGHYSLIDLKDDPFVTLVWEDGSIEEIFNDFRHAGISIKARYRTNSSLIKKEILEEGMAAGVSNVMLTSTFRDTGKYTTTNRLPEEHEMGIMLAWRSTDSLSPAAGVFKRFSLDWFRPNPLSAADQALLIRNSHAL